MNSRQRMLAGNPHSDHVVGVDIGGANLKLCGAGGVSLARRFAMWREHRQLSVQLKEMFNEYAQRSAANIDQLGVTLTGEMADCFATRREGVKQILDHVAAVFPTSATHVYSVHGNWLSPAAAVADPWAVAAGNWRALADWVCSGGLVDASQFDLLVDIGSTTTDLIPLAAGRVATRATTDRQRLQEHQLVYTGMERTPIAALVREVRLADGRPCPLMAELFATTDDVMLTLGMTPEDPTDHRTADGRPRTRAAARARLARMIGEDAESIAADILDSIARQVLEAQVSAICAAVEHNLDALRCTSSARILLTGHGDELFSYVQRKCAVPMSVVSLAEHSGAAVSRSAPALAVACLLAQALEVA